MADPTVRVRPLRDSDLDEADRIVRLAFGTFRGLSDPSASHGDAQLVRPRFRAAPGSAWAAEVDGVLAGSVFATRWGSFGFFGPLTVDPVFWDRGVGSMLMNPVMETLDRWQVRQGGLFTFPDSPKHLGLYQKHGFWPRCLTAVTEKPPAHAGAAYGRFSRVPEPGRADALSTLRAVAGGVFPGLDLEPEILAVEQQGLGDTIVTGPEDAPDGFAVCHAGSGSEAGSDACFVKFGAVQPGEGAAERFDALLDACESFAAGRGAARIVAGVNTGRLDAYRLLLRRGFRTGLLGVSMVFRPDEASFDGRGDFVIDDLR